MRLFRYTLLIGTITFLAFIVAFMPASVVWWFVSDKIPARVVHLSGMEGTPWQGQATMSGDFIPNSKIEWDLHAMDLATLVVEADLAIHGPSHRVTGSVRYSGGTLTLTDVTGWLDDASVNGKVEPLGYEVSGSLDLDHVNARIENNWLTSLDGKLKWSGGRLSYTSARSNLLYYLPALTADLRLPDQSVEVVVTELNEARPVLDLRLQPDGWARVSMRGRLFDLVEQPWPMDGTADDIVMELEEQIWQ